jgi:predicted amidohydrolase YtcJ
MEFQGKIYIENGIIAKIEPKQGFVEIISESKAKKYENAWAYPAFVDAHCHLAGLGMKLLENDFSECRSAVECCDLAKAGGQTRKGWITGRGWNQELWLSHEMPNKKLLDELFQDDPVCFTRVDGHAVWVNSRSLEIAGIDEKTEDPSGGKIVRDKRGEATGILLDNAMRLVQEHIPEYDRVQIRTFIEKAQEELLKSGICGVHDMDVEPEFLEVLKEMAAGDELKLDVAAYVRAQDNIDWVQPERIGRLNITGAKFFLDGALGSRSAALLEDYSDDEGNRGVLIMDETEFYEKCSDAIQRGFDIAAHAIGDSANRVAINVYIKLTREGRTHGSKLRLEHAQTISREDLIKLENGGVICSVQAIHCTSDARMAEKRLGERVIDAYRWRSLAERGLMLLGGSDFPVEPHDALRGIDAFVNRSPAGESEPWRGDERISLDEALKAYTVNTYAALGEVGGQLKAGNKARIVLLDRKLDEGNILQANVLAVHC